MIENIDCCVKTITNVTNPVRCTKIKALLAVLTFVFSAEQFVQVCAFSQNKCTTNVPAVQYHTDDIQYIIHEKASIADATHKACYIIFSKCAVIACIAVPLPRTPWPRLSTL